MYATISDLLKDLFGINIPLPIQSFGFFVALSFLLAAWTLSLELKRKETLGLLQHSFRKITKGKPASPFELFFSALIGFIIGFKLGYLIFNYSAFVENPQHALLSAEGNILLGIAVAVISVYIKFREKKKEQLPTPITEEVKVLPHELVGNFTMAAAVAGLLGAKIFNSLENISEFIKDPIDSLISFSGLTMYGGLIVGAIGVIWYGKKHGVPPLHLCDATAPGLMLAYGFGRIGCQVAGDGDWGIVNIAPKPQWMNFFPDWFWTYSYPHNVLSEGIPIAGCEGKHCYELAQPVFPTPLYEAIVCCGLFFVLWGLRKRFTTTGMMFSVFLLLNGIERFFIELIRVNTKYHIGSFEFTQAQLIATCLILLGVSGIIYFRRKPSLLNESEKTGK